MDPIGWGRNSLPYTSGPPFRYRVIGLPNGLEAEIVEQRKGVWRIWRERAWRGEYETAEKALEALQAEVNDG
jgi:hypothetical protein